MKGIRYAILLLAGFVAGWGAQSVMGIAMRKAANSRFLDESEAMLGGLRAKIDAFKALRGRYPSGPQELSFGADGPPVEIWRRSARWASAWDGQGGFLYLSGTGELSLNSDVAREKFFSGDWKRVLQGRIFPKGKIS